MTGRGHAHTLPMGDDDDDKGVCFGVRRCLPAHSHDCTATVSSPLKFRCPDSPLNLYHPAKPSYAVTSDLTEIALCGLTLIAAEHISESMPMSAQMMHLPGIFGLKLLSDNFFFFFNGVLFGLM